MKESVDILRQRFAELSQRLSDPAVLKDKNQYKAITREHARVEKQLRLGERYLQLLHQVEEARLILTTEKDADLVQMAQVILLRALSLWHSSWSVWRGLSPVG